MGYKFVRGWQFDGAVRVLTSTDLDTAGDPNSDFNAALLEVLSGLGVTVGAPTLETVGGTPKVKIGMTGGGTILGVDDSAVIDLDAVDVSGRHGYIVGSTLGGVEVGAADEVSGGTIAFVVVREGIASALPLTAQDDVILQAGSAGAETARIEAETGSITSPTIVELSNRIAALEAALLVKDENQPRVFSGDIQPETAVDGDLWGRRDPL